MSDPAGNIETVGEVAELYLGNILYAIERAAIVLEAESKPTDAAFYRGIGRKLLDRVLAELIRAGDTGTLFTPDDPAGLAAALAGLLADRSGWEARRTRARAFVERERNWSSNICRYEPIYQRLTSAATVDGSWQRSSARQ